MTGFSYDALGRVTGVTFPSPLSESYNYDAVGNLLTKRDRKGQTISYAYDALDRRTALAQFVAAGRPERLREKAAFWLCAERGWRGYEVLDRMVRHDPGGRYKVFRLRRPFWVRIPPTRFVRRPLKCWREPGEGNSRR